MNINDFWGWIEDEDFYHVKKNIHLIDDINEMGYSGQTLLSLALECRQINIAKFLIDHGADINSHGGQHLATPTHYAIESDIWDYECYILQQHPQYRKNTDLAVRETEVEPLCTEFILKYHPRLDLKDSLGKTALESCRYSEVLKDLVQKEMDWQKENNYYPE